MRLDHLLSTENSGQCLLAGVNASILSGACGVGWGLAGVETIVGFHVLSGAWGCGAGMLLGSRTATRDEMSWAWVRARRVRPVPKGGSCDGLACASVV